MTTDSDVTPTSPVSVGFDTAVEAPVDAPKPVREIPVWAVVAVVVACLGGAAFFAFAFKAPPSS